MIPFVDLAAQYRAIKPEIDEAVARVLASGRYVLGEEAAAFEREFAEHAKVPFAIAVSSGTSALHLALLACAIGPGDEVITPPFTFVATVAAIEYTGARPVFVDVDHQTATLDVDRLEQAISPRTRAIVPVHLYGRPARMDTLLDVAARRGLTVIEDAAQAHGATYKGRAIGTMGDVGCFSFYPTKNLGACGEAGVVVTKDAERARTLRRLRDWGQETHQRHVVRGYNYRMDALQAAILRVKLRHLDGWNDARRIRAARYDRLLAGMVDTPLIETDSRHVYHVYAVRTPHRDELRAGLTACGVETAVHYPLPVHLQPAYASLGYRAGDFPAAEALAGEVLSLPVSPELSLGDLDRVAAAIEQDVHVRS